MGSATNPTPFDIIAAMKNTLLAVSALAAVSAVWAESPVENLVPNAAFELGAVGWHVKTQRQRMDPWTCAPVAFPTAGAWKGRSLRVDVPVRAAVRISSERLRVEPGVTYFVSARVKAETPGRASLSIVGPMLNDWWSASTKGTGVSNVWQRLSGTITVAKGHHEALFSIDWNKPGAFWIDDVQVCRAEKKGFAVRANAEAGFELDDTYTSPGPCELRFRAIAYDKDVTRDVVLKAEHPATGWRQERTVRLELKRGVAVETPVGFDLSHCGELLLSSDVTGDIPVYFAVMPAITQAFPQLGDDFSVGVNETGVFPPIGSWDQNYQGIGRSFAEHMALLRACGVQHVRAFNEDYAHMPVFNPERGVYDATRLEPWLDAMAGSGMPYYMTIKFDLDCRKNLDDWKHWSAARKKTWYLFRESQPTGRNSPTWPDKQIEWLPNVEDVAAACGELAKRCKGRASWYELFNEPNLDLGDPRDCVRYQKAVWAAMKKADPACRIAGICTTQDFGTDDAADFAGVCLKDGIAPYLDALSFHPYASAVDNGIQGAAPFLRHLAAMVKPYPHVGLWNTECFYLLNRSDYPAFRKKDPQFLRPQNLARRTLIDLGEGVKVSSSLHVMQLFRPHFDEMTQHTGEHSGHKLTPTDAAVGLAAFSKLMNRATPVRPLEKSLTDGLCGYLYKLADGRPAAALWAYENLRKFVVRTDATVYDMYGNVLEGKDHPIDERPLYIVGTGDAEAFFRTLAIRPEKPVVVNGARWIDPQTVAVELLNMTDGELRAHVTVAAETRLVLLAEKERRAVVFPSHPSRPSPLAVTCRTDVQTDVFRVRAEPTRKTAKSGERVTVGPLSFAVTLAEEGVVVDATTRDATRTVGTFQLPWTGDTIELFFDAQPDTHLDESRDATGTFRLFVLPPTPDPADAPGHRARALSTNTRKLDIRDIRQRIDEDGESFGCKLTIPWSYFGGKRLDAIGFDIIADDFDPVTKKCTAAHVWSGDTANYESRFKWGRITSHSSLNHSK